MIYAVNHLFRYILHEIESESVGEVATPAGLGEETSGIIGLLSMGVLNYH